MLILLQIEQNQSKQCSVPVLRRQSGVNLVKEKEEKIRQSRRYILITHICRWNSSAVISTVSKQERPGFGSAGLLGSSSCSQKTC